MKQDRRRPKMAKEGDVPVMGTITDPDRSIGGLITVCAVGERRSDHETTVVLAPVTRELSLVLHHPVEIDGSLVGPRVRRVRRDGLER